MMAGRRGPVLTHGAMARADARGHGTGRHTGPWHVLTPGAMARADTRGHGTGRHTGPWHGQTHGAMARPYAWGRWSGRTGTVTVDDGRLRHSPAREGGAPEMARR